MLPYLEALTKQQMEKGLIRCVLQIKKVDRAFLVLTHVPNHRGGEDVSRFRDLIRSGAPYPSAQTSLSIPTETERIVNGLGERV